MPGFLIRYSTCFILTGSFLWIVGAMIPGAQAQDPASRGETVDALVEEALRRHPEIRLYQSRIDAARGALRSASAWNNPNLNVQGGYRLVDMEAGDVDEGTVVAGSISQPFEFPGKASLRKALARGDIALAEWGLAKFRLALAGRIRQQALKAELARRRAELTGAIRQQSEELIRLLQERKLGGARPLLERRLIEAGQLELDDIALHALLERDEAELALHALLGRPPSQQAVRVLISTDERPAIPESLDLLLKQVSTGNLGLKMAQLHVEQAGKSTAAARLDAMPDLSFGPFYSREASPDGQEWALGATLSADLPFWNRNQGAIQESEAGEVMAQARYDLARLEAEQAATLHWKTIRHLDDHFGHLTMETIDRLKDSAALAERQYRQGAIDAVLYLESQKALLDTLEHYHETLTHRQDAWLDLHLLTGGMALDLSPTTNQKSPYETEPHSHP